MKHWLKFWLLAVSLLSCCLASAPLWAESSITQQMPATQQAALVDNTSPDNAATMAVPQNDAAIIPTPVNAVNAESNTATVQDSVVAPAPAIAPAPIAQAPVTVKADSGDTAWILTSTALVLLMTIPGLALFYAGMVRKKNALSTMMYSFSAVVVVSLVWVIVGYSLAFSEGNMFIGGFSKVMLSNVPLDALSGSIPESLFIIFQMTFAIITVAIMSGSFVERMKYSAFMLFIALWIVVVYAPITHWVWGGGFLATAGALDFAGGTVVHINSGIAGLVAAYVVGKRIGFGREHLAPHNLALTVIGASLLWVGWFGFNGGSALAANGSAGMAILVTQVAAAAAALAWLAAERIARGKASVLGGASGAVAGLVVITPAAGFVSVGGAIMMGLIGGVVCFWGITMLKRLLKADDSLDAFGLHGVGGIVGALLTAIFASPMIMGDKLPANMWHQLLVQAEGVVAVLVYSGVMTFILLKVVDLIIGLRVQEEQEREGLDISQHGERIE